MSFKKKGFSLVEIIVVMTIIGIILIIELMIISGRKNQYGAPYYTVYNALKKTSYNILADIYCPNSQNCGGSEYLPSGEVCCTAPRPFPTTADGLCKRMVEFINPSSKEDVHCNQDGGNKYKPVNHQANNINDETTIGFKASNSYKFYISEFYGKDSRTETYKSFDADRKAATTDDRVKYFIVYVDLNGEGKPNSLGKVGDIYPDIVPLRYYRKADI